MAQRWPKAEEWAALGAEYDNALWNGTGATWPTWSTRSGLAGVRVQLALR